jgi:replicative DNA helicase
LAAIFGEGFRIMIVMPHSPEAEQNLLGNLIADPNKIADLDLNEGDFYFDKHKYIFLAIKKLVEAGEEVNLVSINEKLKNNKDVKPDYIASLVDNCTPNYLSHQKIIKQKSLARKMIQASVMMQNDLADPNKNVEEVLSAFQSEILSLSNKNIRGERDLNSIIKEGLERLEKISKNPRKVSGIPSGFCDLDKFTGGFQKSDLIVIAARPSMGKTSFVLDITRNAAREGYKIGIFSLEMSKHQLGDRFISAVSKMNLVKLRNGFLSPDEFKIIVENVQEKLWNLQVFVDDTGVLTGEEIFVRGMRMWKKHQVDMIVIDYLQLIRAKGRSRHEEVSLIVNKLKHLAKTVDIPVIIVSQLNREVERREDKRPKLSDLKESGDIEQSADVVIFIYRDEYYSPKTTQKGIAEITVAKQRNGPVGQVRLYWNKYTTTFHNLEQKNEDDRRYV